MAEERITALFSVSDDVETRGLLQRDGLVDGAVLDVLARGWRQHASLELSSRARAVERGERAKPVGPRRSDVSSLERLGWNSFFEQQVRDGDERVPSALQWSRVVEEQRGACRVAGEYEGWVEISGRFRHQAQSPADFPAVGDWVGVRDAIVHRRLERRSTIARAAAGAAAEQQVMAANVDTIFLVTAATRDLNPRRLERYLTTVWEAGAMPVVVLNKADLTEDPQRACDDLRSRLPLVDVVAVSALGLAARATVEDALS